MMAVLLLLLFLTLPVSAQTTTGSTRAQQEFAAALTDAGSFGVPRYTTALLPACNAANTGAVVFDTTAAGVKVCGGSSWASVAGTVSGNMIVTGAIVSTGTNSAVASTDQTTLRNVDTASGTLEVLDSSGIGKPLTIRAGSPITFSVGGSSPNNTVVICNAGGACSNGHVRISNGALAFPPLVVDDNGTPVFTILDGGNVNSQSLIPAIQSTYDMGSQNALDWRRLYLRTGINDDDANRKGNNPFQLQPVNAATGTDQPSGHLILASGKATGAGLPGNVRMQVPIPLATGTTLQSFQDRHLVIGKRLTLADNTATTFLTVAMGNDTHCGGTVDFVVYADDNTNDGRQLTAGEITFSGVDKTAGAGGEDCDNAIRGTNTTSLSPTNGGTVLTVTAAAATTGTDLCNIRIQADSDLAVVSLITLSWSARVSGSAACTITPQ